MKLPVGQKIPSTNKLYILGRGGKHILKNPEVTEFQEIIVELCRDSMLNEINEFARKVKYVNLISVTCFLLDNFEHRDVTNLTKALEDALSRAIGVNDNRTIEFRIRKERSPVEQEVIFVSMNLELFG